MEQSNYTTSALNFSSYITERTQDFVGREQIFEEIDTWVTESDEARFFIITGEPGSGKSSLAARLCQFSQGTFPPPAGLMNLSSGFLSAFHFCWSQYSLWLDSHIFAHSIAAQLNKRYPAYRQVLKDISNQRISITGSATAGEVQTDAVVAGVYINNLILSTPNAQEAFNLSVLKPLERIYDQGFKESIIILVDGLDESLTFSGNDPIAELLLKLKGLPRQVRLIVTTRPITGILRSLQPSSAPPYSLSSGSGLVLSLADIERYVLQMVKANLSIVALMAPDLSAETFARAVQKKSDGNFLYVYLLLHMLASQKERITLEIINRLPTGLPGIYLEFLQRLVKRDWKVWEEQYAHIMGVLAVAREGLNEAQLASFIGKEQAWVRHVLQELRQFLDADDTLPISKRTYTIFHRSFADFLLDENQSEEYWCEAPVLHWRISNHFLSAWGGLDAGLPRLHELEEQQPADDYGLRFLAGHLKAAGQAKELHALLLNFVWIAAKLNATDIHALISDYNLAISPPHEKSQSANDLELIQRVLQMSAHVLARQKDQLWYQLYERLGTLSHPLNMTFLPPHPDADVYLMPLLPNFASLYSPLIRFMDGHEGSVMDVVGTPDSQCVISGASDGTIRIWQVETGQEIKVIKAHKDMIRALAVSPNGKYIASGAGSRLDASRDTSIKLWERNSGDLLLALKGHNQPISDLEFSPDGAYLVSGSWDQTIIIWNLQDGSTVRTLTGHDQGINAIALTHDGKFIFSVASDGRIKRWDFDTGTELHSIETFRHKHKIGEALPERLHPVAFIKEDWTYIYVPYVLDVVVFPDDERFVTAFDDGLIVFWASGQGGIGLIDHEDAVTSVVVTSDSRYIVSSSNDGTICIWDARSRKLVGRLQDEYAVNRITLLPGTDQMVSTSGRRLKLWDTIDMLLASDDRYYGHNKGIKRVTVVPESQQVVSLAADYSMKVWDMATGDELVDLVDVGDDFTFTPDGHCVSVGASFIKIWDMVTWQLLMTFPIRLYTDAEIKIELLKVLKSNRLLVCSRSGNWTEVSVFNLADGKLQYTGRFGYEDEGWEMWRVMATGIVEFPQDRELFKRKRAMVVTTSDEQYAILCVSVPGAWLKAIQLGPPNKGNGAASGNSPEEYVSEVINFALLHREGMEGRRRKDESFFDQEGIDHNWVIRDMILSPHTNSLFFASGSDAIEQWDISTSTLIHTFIGHTDIVRSLKLFNNGLYLVSVADDETIRVWNVSTGQPTSVFNGLANATQAELTLDDRYLFVSSADSGLNVWDIATGHRVAHFVGETAIAHFTVAPNGQQVVVGEASGRIHFLRLVTR